MSSVLIHREILDKWCTPLRINDELTSRKTDIDTSLRQNQVPVKSGHSFVIELCILDPMSFTVTNGV